MVGRHSFWRRPAFCWSSSGPDPEEKDGSTDFADFRRCPKKTITKEMIPENDEFFRQDYQEELDHWRVDLCHQS